MTTKSSWFTPIGLVAWCSWENNLLGIPGHPPSGSEAVVAPVRALEEGADQETVMSAPLHEHPRLIGHFLRLALMGGLPPRDRPRHLRVVQPWERRRDVNLLALKD